uniref:G-protein coupled receptors family 1 profile domain-containing protein n=1 Tax=Panagrolaimus superbus TaxID=310955 RepID=A0A914YN19_9BILA
MEATKTTVNLTVCQDGVFSDHQTEYRLYGNMPISVIGIFANLLNIIVFADSEMRTLLMNHFLLALSLSDSFFLRDLYPTVVRYSYPLALTTQTCGVYLTVLVSFHRFLGVCHPFRTKRWVTRRPVQYAIISAVIFSIVINIPTWLELDIESCWSKEFNRVSR